MWQTIFTHGNRTAKMVQLMIVGLLFVVRAQAQQLDESWTITVNGQAVQVEADGGYTISNIALPDQFGASGPGSGPDFVADDYVRVTAAGEIGGQKMYAFGPPFRLRQGEVFGLYPLTITSTPPPLPESLRLTLVPTAIRVGEASVAFVEATLADGSKLDVSLATAWTSYRSSNATIAMVDANGMVLGTGPGSAFITAVNDGATSVAEILVTVANDPLTTVVGFVELEDGSRVAGAELKIVGLPLEVTSGVDGRYQFDDVPTANIAEYSIRAVADIGGQFFLGTSTNIAPVPGGLTDAGVIVLGETAGFGPVILSGMDPEDHGGFVGGPGWEMIRDIMKFVVEESGLSPQPSRVVQLGGSSTNALIAQSAAGVLGFTFTHAFGPAISTVNLFDYDAIYMPTSLADVGGGMSQAELDLINQRGPEIITYINTGGGVAAFAQNLPGGYGWFPLTGLQVAIPSTGTGITITPEGQLILSPSAIQVEPFHTAFVGPPGYFGLDVLAVESGGAMQAIIIGGIVLIPMPTGQ